MRRSMRELPLIQTPYELSAEEFAQLRPVGESKAEPAKDQITIPLSREVAEYFRSTGKGWQNRVDEALREFVATHR